MYFSKMPVLSVEISLEKCGESLGAKAGLAPHKSASGLGFSAFGASQSTPRFVPSHQILATPLIIICSSINIFLVIFYLMCSKNLTVQN